MRRTQIYLDEDQKGALRAIAADRGVNLSELVRLAIQEFLRTELPGESRLTRFQALRKKVLDDLNGGLSDEEIDAVVAEVRRSSAPRAIETVR